MHEVAALNQLIFSHSSQRLQGRFESNATIGQTKNFFGSMQPKNLSLMMGNRPSPDFGRDVSGFSQATTVVNEVSASGGDDSLRRQQLARGSQGSGGNYSQDKFSFSGSDTIDIMGWFFLL